MADPNEYDAPRSSRATSQSDAYARQRSGEGRQARADSVWAQNRGTNWFDQFTGGQQRYDQAVAQGNAAEREGWWNALNVPTASMLAQQYDYDARGGADALSAQEAALGQLGSWARGGLTGADRAMMESTRARDAQAARAQQQALMQQMQARGMGGSGADLATQMMASQMGQQQASDAESQMMQGAQERALAAVQAQAQLGGQMRQQSQHETEHQQDANTNAIQQAYENRVEQAKGANNAQTGLQQSMEAASQRRQESTDNAVDAGARVGGALLTAAFA